MMSSLRKCTLVIIKTNSFIKTETLPASSSRPAGFWIENLFPGEVKKLSTSFSVRNLNKNKMWAEIVIQDYTGLFPIQPTGSQSFFFQSRWSLGGRRRCLYGKNKSSSMSDQIHMVMMAWKIYPYGKIIHYFTTPTYVDQSQMYKTYSYIY